MGLSSAFFKMLITAIWIGVQLPKIMIYFAGSFDWYRPAVCCESVGQNVSTRLYNQRVAWCVFPNLEPRLCVCVWFAPNAAFMRSLHIACFNFDYLCELVTIHVCAHTPNTHRKHRRVPRCRYINSPSDKTNTHTAHVHVQT